MAASIHFHSERFIPNDYLHLAAREETKAQTGSIVCPRSHNKEVAEMKTNVGPAQGGEKDGHIACYQPLSRMPTDAWEMSFLGSGVENMRRVWPVRQHWAGSPKTCETWAPALCQPEKSLTLMCTPSSFADKVIPSVHSLHTNPLASLMFLEPTKLILTPGPLYLLLSHLESPWELLTWLLIFLF